MLLNNLYQGQYGKSTLVLLLLRHLTTRATTSSDLQQYACFLSILLIIDR